MKIIKAMPLLLLMVAVCATSACAKYLLLPRVGEPFNQELWNASHPTNRFALLGSLNDEQVYQIWRNSNSTCGIVVQDGKVKELLADDFALDVKRTSIAAEWHKKMEEEHQNKQHEYIVNYQPLPAYDTTYVPVQESYGGSPPIKGLFLGMAMEQTVDALNKLLAESAAPGKATTLEADLPWLFQVEYEKLPLNPADGGKGYNVVEKRILIECLHPARDRNSDWDHDCSTDKYYIVDRFKRECCPIEDEKIYYRDIYPSPLNRGIGLTFDETGHLSSFSLDAEIFNAQTLSLKEFAHQIFEAYKVPVSRWTMASGPSSDLNKSNLGRVLNFYLEEGGYEFQGDGWNIRVSSDNLSGTEVWVGKLAPKPVPSFN